MVMLNPALAPAASVLIMQLTVPPLPTAGLVQVNAGPEVCNSETNVAPTGNGSVIDTFAASLGPVFETVRLYVMLLPDENVAGPLFVTARSARVDAVEIAVDELLPGVGSLVALVTVAVLLMLMPFASLEMTLKTMLNVAVAALAKFAIVQLIGPVPPTAGVVHANVGPAVCVTETNVMPTGTLSVSETVCAPLGPLFVRLTVYVAVIPGVTVAGPDLVTARSAEPTIVVVTEELSFPGFGSMPIGVLVAVAVFVTVAPGRSAAVA